LKKRGGTRGETFANDKKKAPEEENVLWKKKKRILKSSQGKKNFSLRKETCSARRTEKGPAKPKKRNGTEMPCRKKNFARNECPEQKKKKWLEKV